MSDESFQMIKIFYVHGWGSEFDPTSDKVRALSEIGEVHGITVTWADGHRHVFDQLTEEISVYQPCLLYTSPSPRDGLLSRMPSSA